MNIDFQIPDAIVLLIFKRELFCDCTITWLVRPTHAYDFLFMAVYRALEVVWHLECFNEVTATASSAYMVLELCITQPTHLSFYCDPQPEIRQPDFSRLRGIFSTKLTSDLCK